MLEVTNAIPIVMISGGSDPGWGVQSLRALEETSPPHDGSGPREVRRKQLQLFKEAVPKISRVAYLSDIGTAAAPEAAARSLRVTLVPVGVDGAGGLPKALDAIARQKVDAIFIATAASLGAARHDHRVRGAEAAAGMYPFDSSRATAA